MTAHMIFESRVVVIPVDNVDTDQMFPHAS